MYREKLVAKAVSQIGSKEPTGDDKYIKWYNKKKGTNFSLSVAWCAIFVSWVADQVKASAYIPANCNCVLFANYFRKKGEFYCRRQRPNPEPGDIIFYDWDIDAGNGEDHVGIVEKCAGGKVTVIEGNYSDSVKRRTIAANDVRIVGYGVPKYPAGDVNGDGKTDTTDANEVLKTVVGKSKKATVKNADLNANGKVDTGDALEILKEAVKK